MSNTFDFSNSNGQNLIYVYPEEEEFFIKFLEDKGIFWSDEQKEASVISLSKSLTGYIKTPLRKINIDPKYKEINISHILRLYNYVYSYDGIQDDALLDISDSTKSENIVGSFLRKLRENISIGILQDYFPMEQRTNFLKGNVNYITTYQNILKQKKQPVQTRVYNLTPNVNINHLIVGALKKISKSGENSSEAFELLGYFDDVLAITENASEFLNNINFNSKNSRYKKVASDAAMIIDSLYYDSLKGEAGGESFLINFDMLFEKFIKKILFEETKTKDFSDWKQTKLLGTEYLNGSVLSKSFYQPDILYKFNPEDENADFHPSAEAVLDVKNKANGVFNNSDIYQIIMYNQLLYSKKSILVYPSFFWKQSTILLIENNRIPVPEIHSIFINITGPNAETFKLAINNLLENLYEILDK